MSLTTFFFDLDDTIYPASCGLWPMIRARMEIYLHERMQIPLEEIPDLRRDLYNMYGTTLRGLQATRHVDAREYLDYVHDVPLTEYLKPDPAVRKMLLSLPQRKLIFTNADKNHAQRVLEILQLDDIFEDIIDVIAINPYCKPMPEAFQIALQCAGESDPHHCLFVDDAPRNLAAAHQMGFFAVRLGSGEISPEWDASIANLSDLPSVLPAADLYGRKGSKDA